MQKIDGTRKSDKCAGAFFFARCFDEIMSRPSDVVNNSRTIQLSIEETRGGVNYYMMVFARKS